MYQRNSQRNLEVVHLEALVWFLFSSQSTHLLSTPHVMHKPLSLSQKLASLHREMVVSKPIPSFFFSWTSELYVHSRELKPGTLLKRAAGGKFVWNAKQMNNKYFWSLVRQKSTRKFGKRAGVRKRANSLRNGHFFFLESTGKGGASTRYLRFFFRSKGKSHVCCRNNPQKQSISSPVFHTLASCLVRNGQLALPYSGEKLPVRAFCAVKQVLTNVSANMD